MWTRDMCKVFVVAEIGQNHQGSLDIAKQLIQAAKDCGADCVKFQRSNLSQKFTIAALARPYTNVNSWGKTYGDHKAWLEFTIDQYRELQRFADEIGILFTASAMDFTSFLDLEKDLCVPFIKIGSGDADNVPLLRYAASRSVPLIISTGMQDWHQVCNIYNTFRHRTDVALLHCTSSYPTPAEDTMLRMIPLYRRHFPELTIGYSGHEYGIQLSVASVALGAKIVERHFTLDKSWKGTDHQASLNPQEFARMVSCIRAIQSNVLDDSCKIMNQLGDLLEKEEYDEQQLRVALRAVEVEDKKLLECEKPCHNKLDIHVKVSDPAGLSPRLYDSVVGKVLKVDVSKDSPILDQHFKPSV